MDDGGSCVPLIVLWILLLLNNFLLYLYSGAIMTINGQLIIKKVQEGEKKALIINKIIDMPEQLINTIRINNVALTFISGILFYSNFWRNIIKDIIGYNNPNNKYILIMYILVYFLAIVILGFLIIGVDMIVPKRLGAKYSIKISFGLCKITDNYIKILSPFTKLYLGISNQILKLFGIHPRDQFENVTEEEIKSMVNEGHEQGVIESKEAFMIANIFEFGDKQAHDIMTHRKSMILIDGNFTLKEAIDFILSENNSRFPVYIDNIDNIIGVLHLKDAMILWGSGSYNDTKIKDINNFLRKAEFIPETRNIDKLFTQMQSNKIHMVIVIDEYGQTAGLITMEDILEEIVGNILDEYDEDEKNILSHKDNMYVVNGMIPIDELEKETGIIFEEDDYETLNGFLISKLDRIPKDEERPEIESKGVLYKVLNVENRIISLVKIIIPKEKIEEEEN